MSKGNADLFKLLDKISDVAKTLEACQKKNCKKEHAAGKQQKEMVRVQLMELGDQLVEKKISFAQYQQKATAIKSALEKSEATDKLQKCSQDQCSKLVLALYKSVQNMYEVECTKDKKDNTCKSATAMRKRANKKDPITLKDVAAALKY